MLEKMLQMSRNLRLAVAIGVIGIVTVSAKPLTAGPFNVMTSEMEKYLVIGTGNQVAFDGSNYEIGADQEAVSSSDISNQQRVGGSGAGFNGIGGMSSGSAPNRSRQRSPSCRGWGSSRPSPAVRSDACASSSTGRATPGSSA